MGKTFKPNHVYSIYKKGLIREKRLNSKIIVKKSMEVEHFFGDDVNVYLSEDFT